MTGTYDRWVCHRCKATARRPAGDQSPPAWAALVVVDPPLADPHAYERIVLCDSCTVTLRDTWLAKSA